MNKIKVLGSSIISKTFIAAFIIALISAICAQYLATLPYLRVIGGMVLSLILGIIFQFLPQVKTKAAKGMAFISNKFLRLGIILLGVKLNLFILLSEGLKSLILAFFVILFMIPLTYFLCKLVSKNSCLNLLSAFGCSICGAAAVMGISAELEADTDDSVLSVAVVAILGTIFTIVNIIAYPYLNLSDIQYGVLVGASLHEIAHAVAASDVGKAVVMDMAIITKLSRVLLLAPTAIIVSYVYKKILISKYESDNRSHKTLPMPWFMLGFLLSSAIGSFCLYYWHDNNFIDSTKSFIVTLSSYILAMAMAALGFNVNFKVIIKSGYKILTMCGLASIMLWLFCYMAVILFF